MTSPASSQSEDVHTETAQSAGAMGHVPSHLRFWGVAGALLWLDLWSKHWVFKTLAPNEIRPFIKHTIDLRRSLNDGAVFGSFTGQIGLFIGASVFALAFVLYLFARTPKTYRVTQVALALILAGALGNLYDRAFVKADVVSFPSSTGHSITRIGIIVDETDEAIRLGDWPDGTNVQIIARSDARIRRQGVVRDFIKFAPKFPAWMPWLRGRDMWPWIFNVADSALVCGVSILLLSSWSGRKPLETP